MRADDLIQKHRGRILALWSQCAASSTFDAEACLSKWAARIGDLREDEEAAPPNPEVLLWLVTAQTLGEQGGASAEDCRVLASALIAHDDSRRSWQHDARNLLQTALVSAQLIAGTSGPPGERIVTALRELKNLLSRVDGSVSTTLEAPRQWPS